MIATSDFKKGAKILLRGQPYTIVDFQHVKPGKGGAFVRTKMKNLLSGLILEETFRSGEKFESPDLRYHSLQYLYNEDSLYYFMDQQDFEQVAVNKKQIEGVLVFLKEQIVYTALYFEGKVVDLMPPMFLELTVTDTIPGVKGDTAQGAGSKPATLETGLTLNVPLFIKEGDIVKVDTRDNSYIERVKNIT
ncbi:MAG: elongation factor P [Candidatus Babeliales bacterium]